MRRCTGCNVEFAEGTLFCPACGVRVQQTPPDPNTVDLHALSDAARNATRLLTERAAELSPERISELVATAQAPLAGQITELTTALETERTRVTALEQDLLSARRLPLAGATPDPERTHGFRSMEDFLQTALLSRADPRLHAVISPSGQTRDMAMLPGAAGGFLVPPQFADMLTAITPQDALVRPRATVIPAGISPDASVTFPMLNQSGALGVYAGMTGGWVGEGGAKPETQPNLAQMTLTPHEVAAYVDVTDKLLRNNPAGVTQLIQQGFRDTILGVEDVAFISGNGVGRPRGFLGHASNVNVARAGGGLIGYADVLAMFWRMLKLGSTGPIWIGNPSVLPQLQGMATPLGQLVWQPSAREGLPSLLMGYPFVPNERQPVLGAVGDLMFVNLRYYMIQEGVGLSIKDDQGIGSFDHNVTRIKAFRSVDGQPMLATPLLGEDGVSTFSAFVVLN